MLERNFTIIKITIICLVIFNTLKIDLIWAQNYLPKKGAICFRIDDDHPYDQLRRLDSLFLKYNVPYTYGLNSQISHRLQNQDWWNLIRSMQNHGVDIADHSPNHYSQYFELTTYEDTIIYSKHPAIDHINPIIQNPLANGPRVCLKYKLIDSSGRGDECKGYLRNNKLISNCKGIFSPNSFYKNGKVFCMVYFPKLKNVYSIQYSDGVNSADVDTLYLQSFWNEQVSLANQDSLSFILLDQFAIEMLPESYKLMSEYSQKIFALHHIQWPNVWIQPGGNFPMLSSGFIRENGSKLGYTCAATYPGLYKMIGENDSKNEGVFSFQWGDFYEENQSADDIIKIIADRYARHYFTIGTNHLSAYGGNFNFDQLLANIAKIIVWCQSNQIPIVNYSTATTQLYHGKYDDNYDIMPALNTDLDKNLIPDGYSDIQSNLKDSGGVAYSNFKSICANSGTLFNLSLLGGILRDTMTFEVQSKGGINNDEISFFISMSDVNAYEIIHIPCNTSTYAKYTKRFKIPEGVSRINLNVNVQSISAKTLCISGMKLYAEAPTIKIPSVYKNQLQALNDISLKSYFSNSVIADDLYKISVIKNGKYCTAKINAQTNMLSFFEKSFWTGHDSIQLLVSGNKNFSSIATLHIYSSPESFCEGQQIKLSCNDSINTHQISWQSSIADASLQVIDAMHAQLNASKDAWYLAIHKQGSTIVSTDSIFIQVNPNVLSLRKTNTINFSGTTDTMQILLNSSRFSNFTLTKNNNNQASIINNTLHYYPNPNLNYPDSFTVRECNFSCFYIDYPYVINKLTNGVTESKLADNIHIYPNPNKGIFTLNMPRFEKGERVQLFDMRANLIKQENIISNSTIIDISNYPTGIYFIVSEKHGTLKFIRE